MPLPRGLRALAAGLGPTVRYLFGLESHVYACAIAANAYLWAWPVLGFRRVDGPFFVSVTLLVWGYLSALVVLAGTELAARQPDRTQP